MHQIVIPWGIIKFISDLALRKNSEKMKKINEMRDKIRNELIALVDEFGICWKSSFINRESQGNNVSTNSIGYYLKDMIQQKDVRVQRIFYEYGNVDYWFKGKRELKISNAAKAVFERIKSKNSVVADSELMPDEDFQYLRKQMDSIKIL
jgi:hypothetical protein